ncbi:hypothetical protein [Microvirga alba]|uniref:Uncharacterized protein n=1 Tax=Microvirga alba TaxID=2791025 RepID=A0A931FQY9_9HYPH|nr:hypothetical protein [Microvirga alba]MBF9233963.1 hypothetical protein [Microvirga alba]
MTEKREQIARVIAPHPFAAWQRQYDYCIKDGDSEDEARDCADQWHGNDINAAYEKADAILALPAATGDIGELVGMARRDAVHLEYGYLRVSADGSVNLIDPAFVLNRDPAGAALRTRAEAAEAKVKEQAEENERLKERVNKLIADYDSQTKFADVEAASYFREFIRRARAAIHGGA